MDPSWIDSANDSQCDFPLSNLPFCVFRSNEVAAQVGVAIGDKILNLTRLAEVITLPCSESLNDGSLNQLAAQPAERQRVLRAELIRLLEDRPSRLRDDTELVGQVLVDSKKVKFDLPISAGDFSDFYASIYHATNVGAMFRPDQPLMPNYKHLPVGYHARSSSLVVSGTEIKRPSGQISPAPPNEFPEFQQSSKLDYELELGVIVGPGNELGKSISLEDSPSHIFGFCLLNDWSARDLQKWEYQPLGPFLAKSFATSLSPFLVTPLALEPFRVPAFERSESDPALLPHLDSPTHRETGGIDIQMEVVLTTEKMRDAEMEPYKISSGNFRDMYWTVNQMLVHHSSNGCNLRPGDLIGSGTVSGPEKTSRGCLLERNWNGEFNNPVSGSQRSPFELPTGEKRDFLENGDEVTMTAFCENETAGRIGFGSCAGRIIA